MANYAISFRFDDQNHGWSYDERYKSFIEQLRKTEYWEETTSFVLVTTSETIEEFADRLYTRSYFDAAHDLMLVMSTDTGVAVSRGPFKYPSLLGSKFRKLIQK